MVSNYFLGICTILLLGKVELCFVLLVPVVAINRCDLLQALGDVFESVMGAVYVDSNYNMAAAWNVARIMMGPVMASVRRIAL